MAGYESLEIGNWWWIFPIVMMILCFVMMRGRMCCMMGGHDSQGPNDPDGNVRSDPPREILDRRYALGEINKEEYEEKKRDISS
ncbi:MAG: SHOCT domain-containing protein [Proteobacteria bacterium]|nr:SHOCT domain-containing protein [Pseudomonadota bacterium]